MRTHLYFVLTGWLALTPMLSAQPINPHGAIELPTYTVPERDAETDEFGDPGVSKSPTSYFSVDALFWWTKPNNVDRAIVGSLINPAASYTASPGAGSLTDPNAYVLYGNQDLYDNLRYGVRVNWQLTFDDMNTCGLELAGLYLPQFGETTTYTSSTGVPALALLYNNVTAGFPGTQSAQPIAGVIGAGTATGSVYLDEFGEFWGGDLSYIQRFVNRNSMLYGDISVGFRHQGLYEGFSIYTASTNGGLTSDRFRTRNLFYGLQSGFRVGLQWEHYSVQFLNKSAIGFTDHKLDLMNESGGTGFYVRGSNRGVHRDSSFSVVNESTVSATVAIRPNIALTGGYTFLFWTNVQRPTNQLDENISFSPTGLSPGVRDEKTWFWGQGGSISLEFLF